MADFADTNVTLQGGYFQAGFRAAGSEAEGGLEPLLRLEYTRLGVKGAANPEVDGATLMAATLGANYWMNQWARRQLDVIAETTSKKGNGDYAGASSGRILPTAMAQFQIKF